MRRVKEDTKRNTTLCERFKMDKDGAGYCQLNLGHNGDCDYKKYKPESSTQQAPEPRCVVKCWRCGKPLTRQTADGEWMCDCSSTPFDVPAAAQQAEASQLRSWKESAMRVLNGIDLQEVGKIIGLPLGTDIGPRIVPELRRLKEEPEERQRKVSEWCKAAFGTAQQASVAQRALRMLEEAIEAYQAANCSEEMAHNLVAYVFSRPVGLLSQEIGGLRLSILALAEAAGVSADAEEFREIKRVMAKPLEHFAKRNQAKNEEGFLVKSLSEGEPSAEKDKTK